MSDPATVTQLLNAAQTGDSSAIDRLFPLIYDELRQRAHAQRVGYGGHATMNTTAIVHEAYFKLASNENREVESNKPDVSPKWHSRAHFFAVAAKAMRHVFLDYAKRKNRIKRGEGVHHVVIDETGAMELAALVGDEEADQVIALDVALLRLAESNARAARVVECRFFGGMTVEDTANALGISPATVKRDWLLARVQLFRLIAEEK